MGEVNHAELDRMLNQALKVAPGLYKERGFQRRVGFGKKPAINSVDLANAWTRPGNPYTRDQKKMDSEIIPNTILVTSVTACACVRQTVCDSIADGFRTIAVKEAIGDRVPGGVAWDFFDIDAKFGDVETLDTCVDYLNNVAGRYGAAQ